jgi:hypothetical protein
MRDYYRLTYRPTNEALDGRYRAIRVKVGVAGAVVTARNGYQASARPTAPTVVPHDVAPHVSWRACVARTGASSPRQARRSR